MVMPSISSDRRGECEKCHRHSDYLQYGKGLKLCENCYSDYEFQLWIIRHK